MIKRVLSLAIATGAVLTASSAIAAPIFAWAQTVSGTTPDGADIVNAVGQDALGNVYAVGSVFNGSPGDFLDIVIVKYNAAGVVQWTRTYDRNGFDDVAFDAKVDVAGNVYVTGYSALDGTGTNTDVLVLKVTTTNTIAFATTFVPSSNDVDEFGYSIAIDSGGNAYIAGEAGGVGIGFGQPYDAGLYRVNAAGAFVWQRVFAGSLGDYERLDEVIVAPNGDAIATGWLVNANADAVTARVTSANSLTYLDIYNTSYAGGTAINENGANDVAVDSAGNAYIVGITYKDTAPVDRQESFLRKLNATGVPQWTNLYDGIATGLTYANDVATTGAGVSYVVGETTVGGNSPANANQYIRRVTTAGVQSHVTTRDGGFGDFYSSVGLGGNGNIIASGFSDLDGSAVPANKDGVLGEYSATNVSSLSVTTYNGAGNDWDTWDQMTIVGGSIIVCGQTYSTFTDGNGLLVKYATNLLVNPATYTVLAGFNFVSNLSNLFLSDNLKNIILMDSGNSVSIAQLDSVSPIAVPSSFVLRCEVSSTRTDLTMFTWAFNYVANDYDLLDTRLSTQIDVAYTASMINPLVQYIGPGNAISSQHHSIPNQDLLQGDGWTTSIDRWQWDMQ